MKIYSLIFNESPIHEDLLFDKIPDIDLLNSILKYFGFKISIKKYNQLIQFKSIEFKSRKNWVRFACGNIISFQETELIEN